LIGTAMTWSSASNLRYSTCRSAFGFWGGANYSVCGFESRSLASGCIGRSPIFGTQVTRHSRRRSLSTGASTGQILSKRARHTVAGKHGCDAASAACEYLRHPVAVPGLLAAGEEWVWTSIDE